MAIIERKKGVTTGGKPAPGTKGAPVSKGADAFMQKLASATAAPAGFDITPGQYEALCYKADIYNEKPPAEAIFLEYVIVNSEKMDGKTCRTYYNITDKDGNDGNGYDYLKRDLGNLQFDMDGYPDQASFVAGLSKWAEEEKVWVVIDVKKNGNFTNVYLNSIMDDQPSKPELPF